MPLHRYASLLTLAVVFQCVGFVSIVQAESFVLKSGGAIEGEWLNPKRATADGYEMRTPEGIHLVLSREQVSKVFAKRDIELEYEKKAPSVSNTVDAQWKMAEWCREAGLKVKREIHLQEILKLDAAHEGARLALGYQRYDGEWQKPDEHMTSLGYVRHQGRWITPQDVAILKLEAEQDAAEVDWRQKIRLWKSWLGKKRDLEARENFREIRDPQAASILAEAVEDKDNSLEFRLMALDALVPLAGHPGEGTLITLATDDAESRIRERCLDALVKYQSKRAVFRFAALLKSKENAKVNRAAVALGYMGNPVAVPDLIDALVTTHEFMMVPGGSSPGGGGMGGSFTPDGSGGGGGMSWGAPKPVKIKREMQNNEVLSALTAIVGNANFTFNEAAWKKWYMDQNEPVEVNLRRSK